MVERWEIVIISHRFFKVKKEEFLWKMKELE